VTNRGRKCVGIDLDVLYEVYLSFSQNWWDNWLLVSLCLLVFFLITYCNNKIKKVTRESP